MPTETVQSSTDVGRATANREADAGLEDDPRGSSVVLKQRQQVITAVAGKVGGAQVGQQLVRVGQFGKKLENRQRRKKRNEFNQTF